MPTRQTGQARGLTLSDLDLLDWLDMLLNDGRSDLRADLSRVTVSGKVSVGCQRDGYGEAFDEILRRLTPCGRKIGSSRRGPL
jgi:hypothetical protein